MTLEELIQKAEKAGREHTGGATKKLSSLVRNMKKKKYVFNLTEFKSEINNTALNGVEKKALINASEKVKVGAKKTEM